jgi:ribosome maturation factor RimP
LAQVHQQERELTREVSQTVEQGLPGVEVLAVELSGPERFTVYIDHPTGVDHALCERVTGLLRGYLDRYTVDVSSPGIERPLRTPAHFRNAVGRKVSIRTENDIDGRKRFRGTVADARQNELALEVADRERVTIPYDAIVRGNLVDEGH